MIKSELVQRIAQQRLGLNSRDVAKIVDTIERNCCSSHARRIGVEWRGFGAPRLMIKRKSLDARLRPTASQWEALELARKTGTLRRRNGGLWVPTDTPDGLPDYPRPYNFPPVTTATVRACIGRGWLESTGRDFVTITLIGKRVLTHRRHTVSTAI